MTYKDPDWAQDLVAQLEKWKSDRKIMAELRRGRGKDPIDCISMHKWISRFISDNQVNTGKEWAVYTIASQFAIYPDFHNHHNSLGWSLQLLAQKSTSFSKNGIEVRLIRLTRSRTSAELCRRLPGILSLMAKHSEVGLSWSRLAADINRWDFNKSHVTRCWLRDFFDPQKVNPQELNTPVTTKGVN